MRNRSLAADYVGRAEARVRALDVLFEAESWADVVRESQEVVELALKGLLRAFGVEPPRIHDVSDVLLAERDRLPEPLRPAVPQLAQAGRRQARPGRRPRGRGGGPAARGARLTRPSAGFQESPLVILSN